MMDELTNTMLELAAGNLVSIHVMNIVVDKLLITACVLWAFWLSRRIYWEWATWIRRKT